MSNLAKLLKKHWGKLVEDLIFEKPRRKSTSHSGIKSLDGISADGNNVNGDPFRGRLNSMDG